MPKDKVVAEHELTKPHSHIATRHGYAAGRIIEPGVHVPAGIAIADAEENPVHGWMQPNPDYVEGEEASEPVEGAE